MQTHRAPDTPPETHGHMPLHGQGNKPVPSRPTRTAKPHECVHTQTYRCRHGEWSAGTRAPEEPQIEKKKTTERQGKPWIPRGKWVPLMPRPRALTACPTQDAQIPAALCSSRKDQVQGSLSKSYPLSSQDRRLWSRVLIRIWPSLCQLLCEAL